MRRWVLDPLRRWGCRSTVTLPVLLSTQKKLVRGRTLTNPEASDFVKFFNVPLSIDDSIERNAREYFESIQTQIAAEQEVRVVREQQQEVRIHQELPIFLIAYDFGGKCFSLFSITTDKVVLRWQRGPDTWEQAGDLMAHTRQSPQFILIPVVEVEKERRVLQPLLEELSTVMYSSGLQPVTHVDTMELSNALGTSFPSLGDVTLDALSGVAPKALTEQWFRAHWIHLRTSACKASELDPVQTINSYISPRYDVYVVHLVRAGSRGMNISMYDPVRHRRLHAKGMLSDVIACLFETRSKQFILIPTNRTDRSALLRCRVALHKAGHQCLLVFASEVEESYRKVYHSDPRRYWEALKSVHKTVDSDLLFKVCATAGNTLRETRKKLLKNADPKSLRDASPCPDTEIVSSTDVDKWLTIFSTSKRRAAERTELRHYKKYVIVAFTSSGHFTHGQPRNSTAAINHVIATCWMDAAGEVLEPWVKYTARGQCMMPCLDGCEVLVAHNAKELLLLMWGDPEVTKFLHRGGRVWCTMLAEYLLSAQRFHSGRNSLNDLALQYGFLIPESTKLGMSPDSLPLAFHRKHLMQAAPALVSIFRHQLEKAACQSQLLSISHRMDSLLAMACMQWAGIRIDLEEADRQARAIRDEALVLDRCLSAYVPPEVPIDMHEYFDWESAQHLRAYFFGGTIFIGQGGRARASSQWTSNLVHLCHRYGPFKSLVGELHLQRYANEHNVPTAGGSLPQRVAASIAKEGTQQNKKYRLVVFDVETTGLNATTDEIIEVAMFDPVENTSLSSLVNPKRPISPNTVEIHHITDAAVKDAPTMDALMPSILRYLRLDEETRDSNEVIALVGHNVFGVDEPMLRRAFLVYAPETEHDSLIFCDSLAMLRALKVSLQDSKLQKRAVDKSLLETLTSSLRLGKLIENLRVSPQGQLHRADTDTKALWFVLVAAFGLTGQTPAKQRDSIFAEATKTLVTYPATGCFVPTERKRNDVQIRLPGVAHQRLTSKVVSSLQSKVLNESVLDTLHHHGLEAAGHLLQRLRLDRHALRFLEGGQRGHLSALHADNAVHQLIDMTATTTSRTTSAYPSCQNIPKDDKSSVRRLFVSRFGSKGRCVEVDYSQLEIVVLAILCQDEALANDLRRGVDFHVKRAEFFSGLPYKDIYEGYKKGVPKYVKLRKTAKQFSFQRLYGAGIPLLHKTTSIPVKDLEASIAMEDKAYPEIAHFHRKMRAVALRPSNPGLPTSFVVEMPTGVRMSFKTRDVILNLPPVKNYPIQGYGAELAQMMLGRLFRHFVKKKFYNEKAFLINFVHDSVWLDCHVDVLEACVRDTCRILSEVHTYVPKKFPGVEVCVPLNVSAACGLDMCSMQNINNNDFSFIRTQKKSSTNPDLLDSAFDVAPTTIGENEVMDSEMIPLE